MSRLKNIAKFNVAISELIDVPNPDGSTHPFATIAKFIFADDRPNGNKQGIKVEEFPNVIRSSIGMPIKMNFTGFGVADHGGSVPIGHIRKLEHVEENGVNLLVCEAMLWKEEYPEELEYLQTAHASGKAPGLSYEIAYENSVTENDTQWITGTTTQAATFVARPAYGSRTHLLALASLSEEDRNTEILALAEQIKTDREDTDEGGNLMEKELEEAKAEVARLLAEAAIRDTRITELEGSLATAETDKGTALAELATLKEGARIETRVQQYVAAGFPMETEADKADALKTVFASFNDDQWDFYLTSLKTAKPAEDKGGEAFASLLGRSNDIPKIEVALDDDEKTGLKAAMRTLARPHSI